MPMTLEHIIQETRTWPPEKLSELVRRWADDLHASAPDIQAAWESEINGRVEEIQSGKVQGISAAHVFERSKRILGG